ncbi:MAG TPA: hypothetical protein VFL14_12825 [Xanthomonadales bacterium]|nr:hypothetical protein [Xanthomonadales bacterium]
MKTRLGRVLCAALFLLPLAASATSVTGAKVSRVRIENNGFAALTLTIVPSAGCRTATNEHYTFDARTDLGRARLLQLLIAYGTQSRVDAFGTSTCTTLSTGASENLSTLTVY